MNHLYSELLKHHQNQIYPMHMPGHKRNFFFSKADNLFELDITEIDGFDDLYHPEGILKEAMEKAANTFKAKETVFLVNGSTVGILASILGCTDKGDTIILSRNCHKSVYHGLYLNELCGKYIIPDEIMGTSISGNLSLAKIETLIKSNKNAKVIVITSPSYEGVVQNIKEIVRLAHQNNMLVIVDEAHGAHLNFHPDLPESAVSQGADFVIQSTHKTLPMLTQTALLHINIDKEKKEYRRVKNYLSMLQTSSPSYLLMGSIDYGITYLNEQGKSIWDNYLDRIHKLREEILKMSSITLLDVKYHKDTSIYDYDISKLAIIVPQNEMTGNQLAEVLLNKYKIQLEMSQDSYALAMTSVMDTKEGYSRLLDALIEIDRKLNSKPELIRKRTIEELSAEMNIYSAVNNKGRKVLLKESAGYISKEYIYLYPPGIPIIVPGEIITESIISKIREYIRQGLNVRGLNDKDNKFIYIADNI